jgi:hypothetical protein
MARSRKENESRPALPAPKETPAALMEAAQRDVEQLRQQIVRCEALAQVVDDVFEDAVGDHRRRLLLAHLVELNAKETRTTAVEASKLCEAMMRRANALRGVD